MEFSIMTLPFPPYFSWQLLRKTELNPVSFCTQCFKARGKNASSTKHINPSSHWKTRWEGIFFSMFNHQRDYRSLLVRSLTWFPSSLPSHTLNVGYTYLPLLSFIEPMYLIFLASLCCFDHYYNSACPSDSACHWVQSLLFLHLLCAAFDSK